MKRQKAEENASLNGGPGVEGPARFHLSTEEDRRDSLHMDGELRKLAGHPFHPEASRHSIREPAHVLSRPVVSGTAPFKFPREVIKALPKADLHVHLDGSLRLETLIDLSRKQGKELPYWTVNELKQHVFKPFYSNLMEYLECFSLTVQVMKDEQSLERIAYEFAVDNYEEMNCYFEVRFAPQLHASRALKISDILRSVNKGLAKAQEEYNQRYKEDIDCGLRPPYLYGIIVCGMRKIERSMSEYYEALLDLHSYSNEKNVAAMASLELARAAVALRNEESIPIVAFDIAGAEDGYPAEDHVEAYRYVHQHFMGKTVHAGEAYGPESIFQAISKLNAERIGHGFHLFNPEMVQKKEREGEEEQFVSGLVEYIAAQRRTIEVCVTSNMQTMPTLRKALDDSQIEKRKSGATQHQRSSATSATSMKVDASDPDLDQDNVTTEDMEAVVLKHEVKRMVGLQMSVVLCTDNRLVSRTDLTREVRMVANALGFTPSILRDVIFNAFKRSFMPLSYPDKRRYMYQVLSYYDRVMGEWMVENGYKS
eukprot:Clim_evm66s77 gene=Clim_evmTU66s77